MGRYTRRPFEKAASFLLRKRVGERFPALSILIGTVIHSRDPAPSGLSGQPHGAIDKGTPFGRSGFRAFDLTFYPLLFTLWARQLLDMSPGFEVISLDQGRAFFRLLREGDTSPPYRMFGFEERFLKAFEMPNLGPADCPSENLREALSLVWRDFSNEIERVSTDAVDAKYSKYIMIAPS